MRLLREPLAIVRAHRRAYLVLNTTTYGLLLLGMATGLVFPSLTEARVEGQAADGTVDQVVDLLGNVWLFAATILAVNLTTMVGARLLVPSLVVPYAGLALLSWKAFSIGLTLAPADEARLLLLIPHSLAMLIEFQAYVLFGLATWVHARAWLRPRTVDAPTRGRGYLEGLRRASRLWVPAFLLLVLGAVYEAVELIYLVPPLVAG